MASTDIQVKFTKNPITQEKEILYAPLGVSLHQIITDAYGNSDVKENIRVIVDGKNVDVKYSVFIYPKKSVEIFLDAKGEVAIGLLIGAAIAAVTGFVTYRLMKRKFGDQIDDDDPEEGIRNVRNRRRPYQAVPIILGKRKIFPDLVAEPWFEYVGETQFVRLLLGVGYAPLKISDIKIGDSPIGNFGNDVEFQVFDAFENTNVPTLYPSDIIEQTIDQEINRDGQSITRITANDTDEIALDITFPSGLARLSSTRGLRGASVTFRVETRPAGSTGAFTTRVSEAQGRIRSDGTNKPFTRGFKFNVPRGQYEVRLTRVTSSSGSSERIKDTTWTVLRSIRDESPVNTNQIALIALRLRADAGLSGSIDRINCIAESVVPSNWISDWSDWRVPVSGGATGAFSAGIQDSMSRVTNYYQSVSPNANNLSLQVSNNPADLFRWAIQGPFIKKKIENNKIELNELLDFREKCNDNDLFVNEIVERELTLAALLNNIARVGYGELTVKAGKFSVFIDEPRDAFSAVFSFKNCNSIAVEREFLEPIDGYRVEFDNEELEYEKDEIAVLYEDITQTTGNFERLSLWGITDYDQAYSAARRLLAERRLRQEAFSFTANVEAADVTRGDLVLLNQPVIGIGTASGRIKQIDTNNNVVITDEINSTVLGETDYGLQVITNQNTVLIANVISVDGNEITLDSVTGLSVGDRYNFGVLEQESLECIVEELKPNADLTFDLKLINYAPAVFDADELPIPPYETVANLPTQDSLLPSPYVKYITPLRTRTQSDDGRWYLDVHFGYGISGSYAAGNFEVELQYRQVGDVQYTSAGRQDARDDKFVLEGLTDLSEYEFRIRTRSVDGRDESAWVDIIRFLNSNVQFDPPTGFVTGLKLYGTEGNEFTGRDVKIEWRQTSVNRSYDLGQEPAGGDDGGFDPYFKDYIVRVLDPETNEIIREEFTKDTKYEYTFEKNVEDGGPRRTLRFAVGIRGTNNQISEDFRKITVTNPPPPLHTNFNVLPRFTGAVVTWNPNPDIDFAGTIIYIGEESGFELTEDKIFYNGPDTEAIIEGLEGETTYFLVYQTYDAFGRDLATTSGELTFTTFSLTDTLDLGPWATIEEADRAFIEENLANDAVPSVKIENLTAAKLTSGVLQATEIIQTEGTVRSVDNINTPSFEVTLGPQEVDNTTWLLNANQVGADEVIFGIDEFGNLVARNGTFSGTLEAVDGTFSGTLSAVDGTFTGELSAATGTFSGDLSAAGGTFTGDLTAAGGTFSGDLSAAGGTFTGNLTAAGGTFNGNIESNGLFQNSTGEKYIDFTPGAPTEGDFVLGDVSNNSFISYREETGVGRVLRVRGDLILKDYEPGDIPIVQIPEEVTTVGGTTFGQFSNFIRLAETAFSQDTNREVVSDRFGSIRISFEAGTEADSGEVRIRRRRNNSLTTVFGPQNLGGYTRYNADVSCQPGDRFIFEYRYIGSQTIVFNPFKMRNFFVGCNFATTLTAGIGF